MSDKSKFTKILVAALTVLALLSISSCASLQISPSDSSEYVILTVGNNVN